ncbi:MAG: EF-hand domain-containing protein [Rhodanobacter sp.]
MRRCPHARTAGIALLLAGLWLHVPPCSAQNLPNTPGEYLRAFDRNGDGKVSPDEYVAYLSRGFRRMDSNGDGILERDELPGRRGQPVTLRTFQANLLRQFHRLDRNHDGYLDARELTAPPR